MKPRVELINFSEEKQRRQIKIYAFVKCALENSKLLGKQTMKRVQRKGEKSPSRNDLVFCISNRLKFLMLNPK
jgi:hypothetical protein